MPTGPVKIRIKIEDRNYRRIEKELLKFGRGWVLVGLFEGEQHVSGVTVAAIGFFNEFGTRNIPERSWMRSWFDTNLRSIKAMIIRVTNKIKERKITAERALNILGAWAVGELKKSIIQLRTPPNAPVTIARKGSSNPLIDTGQMLNTIRYKVGFGRPPETGV